MSCGTPPGRKLARLIIGVSTVLFFGYVYLWLKQKKNYYIPPMDSYQDRLLNIEKYCEIYRRNETMWKKVSMGQQPYPFRAFVIDGYKAMWVDVPKCASTTIRNHVFKLKESKDEDDRKKIHLRFTSSENLKEKWRYKVEKEGFLTFAFVRHPFVRILSAYKSKMEDERSDGFEDYRLRNEEIARAYRAEDTKPTVNRTTSTFSEFVSAVIDKFIEDRHWRPISNIIHPCELTYTFIGRVETFDEDLKYLFTKINASFIDRSVWQKRRDSNELVQKYYSTISNQTLLLLYEIYKTDFELFGYDPTEYFAYVKT